MQIVSGIATASGVSPLLNAPRDVSTQIRATVGEAARAENVRRKDQDERVVTRRESARPVDGPDSLDRPDRTPDRLPAQSASEADQRRERFVESVTALRRDAASEPRPITQERLDSVRRSDVQRPTRSEEPFPLSERAGPPSKDSISVTYIDDGIPQPVEPPEPKPEAKDEEKLVDLADDGVPKQLEPLETKEPLTEPA